jgi:predicted TIM-barrel fold metal-dependent hydrolase
MVLTAEKPVAVGKTARGVIDCDIHPALASPAALRPYLPEAWQAHHAGLGGFSYAGAYYPRMNPNAARSDAWPPSGLPPGADLEFMQQQLLDAWNIQHGVLQPLLGAGAQRNLEYGAAMARAINDWLIAEWLIPERRLRASLVVPYEDGDLAAAEIHRMGDYPGFLQIMLVIRASEPLGRRKYWKMYQAAVEHDLPIGIHFGGAGGGPITGVGWPSFYVEDHAGMSSAFQAQVISFVCEGVFEEFPTLKVVLIEGGFAWLPPLAWRLDAAWKMLKAEVPRLKRLPSEYIHDHIWLTTQPMEEPHKPEQFVELLESFPLADRLMFSTDYPHWDFDAPDQALPKIKLPDGVEDAIMAGNARELYRL